MKKYLFVFLVLVFLVPAITAASFDVSLKYGSHGNTVVELQDFLQGQGSYYGKVDGKFGFGTLKAVRAFQTSNGLKADGYFGAMSRTKANEILKVDLEDSNTAEQAETGTVAVVSNVEGCDVDFIYSRTTGLPCSNMVQPVSNLPAGCLSLSGYSILTGLKCNGIQTVNDPATQAKIDALTSQIKDLSSSLNTIANNKTPVPTPTPIPAPIDTPIVLDALTFIQTPKIVYKNVCYSANKDNGTVYQICNPTLSYISYTTNRSSKIIGGPIVNEVNVDGSIGWTTKFGAGDSCNGTLASTSTTTVCKITAKADDNGVTSEATVHFPDDIIILQ